LPPRWTVEEGFLAANGRCPAARVAGDRQVLPAGVLMYEIEFDLT
jgi:hypothetical protein